MPLFLIRRDVEPGLTAEEVEAASFRALCFAFLCGDMRWIRSYWDRDGGRFYCIYEAQSIEQIQEHSRRARVPCDEVRQVVELGPEPYLGQAAPVHVPNSVLDLNMPLFLIIRDVEPGLSTDDLTAASFRELYFDFLLGMRWIRSYWDRDSGRFYCIYEAQSEEQIREHSRRASVACDEVRQVVQLGPEQYIGQAAPMLNASVKEPMRP